MVPIGCMKHHLGFDHYRLGLVDKQTVVGPLMLVVAIVVVVIELVEPIKTQQMVAIH